MKYIEGSNLLRDWQLLTEDQKFGCSDITVKNFLIEHAFSLQTGKDRANTGRQYLWRSNVIFKDSNVGDLRRYLSLLHLRRKKRPEVTYGP